MTIDEILYLKAAGVSAADIAAYTAGSAAQAPQAEPEPEPAEPVQAPQDPVQAPQDPAQAAQAAPQAVPPIDANYLADAIVAALQARNIGTSGTPVTEETAEDVLAKIINPTR